MQLKSIVVVTAVVVASASLAGVKVEDMAGWRIIVSENAIPSENYAAEEFKRLFEESVGIKLTISTDIEKPVENILIGPGSAGPDSPLPIEATDLGDEGLRIRIAPKNISIAGGRPRGTLYGVYEFFEKRLGVRFLTADHTYYPPDARKKTLPVGEYSYIPPFSFRWSYYKENSDRPDFAARLRVNTVTRDEKFGGVTPQSLINHSLYRYLPPEKYGEEQPEYFALVGGERLLEVGGGGPEPCVTNPAVIDIVSKGVIADLDQNPNQRNISVSQNDNDEYCRCAACEAINQSEGTPMGSHLAFVNAVAERVEKKHPNVKIGTLAYWYTRQAPKTIRPRENMQIQLCSIECCTLHPINDPNCKKNRAFCKDMEDWKQINDDIWIWNYNTNFSQYDLPFPNLRAIGPNVQFFSDNNVKGVFMQANGNGNSGEMCDLRNYVIARCLWEPGQDSWELTSEFCRLHYGNAAPIILEYLAFLHDNAEEAGVHPTCFPTASEVGLNSENARRIKQYFEDALSAAEDEVIRERVERASICAYKAMISTRGNLIYDPGGRVCKLDLAPDEEGLIEKYRQLCKKHNMTRSAERTSIDEYLESIQGLEGGIPAVQVENDAWRLTLIPSHNGKVLDLTHKESGRNLVEGHRSYRRLHAFEEWGRSGYDHEKPLAFDVSVDGDSVLLTKQTEEGLKIERRFALPATPGGRVRFETVVANQGGETQKYQIKTHPEFHTGTYSDDSSTLSVYLKDGLGWLHVNEIWEEPDGNEQAERLKDASGGAFAFFNHDEGFGVIKSYDPETFDFPRLWWSPGRRQVDLELITPVVEIGSGEDYVYAYEVAYLDQWSGRE